MNPNDTPQMDASQALARFKHLDGADSSAVKTLEAALADTARLDWLTAFITENGSNGISNILWSVFEEEPGDVLLERHNVMFDRAAIDNAMASAQPEAKG